VLLAERLVTYVPECVLVCVFAVSSNGHAWSGGCLETSGDIWHGKANMSGRDKVHLVLISGGGGVGRGGGVDKVGLSVCKCNWLEYFAAH